MDLSAWPDLFRSPGVAFDTTFCSLNPAASLTRKSSHSVLDPARRTVGHSCRPERQLTHDILALGAANLSTRVLAGVSGGSCSVASILAVPPGISAIGRQHSRSSL